MAFAGYMVEKILAKLPVESCADAAADAGYIAGYKLGRMYCHS